MSPGRTNSAWRDEAEFHRVFTALLDDPAMAGDAPMHIAYALTGDRHVTREAALGAIETFFHERDQHEQQEQASARGGVVR
jgi:hypothetical protein